MKKTHHDAIVRKLVMLGAALTLLLGLPLAIANRAFSNPTPEFAYVANDGDGTVSAYAINSSTGALSAVLASPFASGNSPQSVTVDPSTRFAYVVNYRDDTVSAYTIDTSTGALSPVAGSPFATGRSPVSVAVEPSGQFAYVANRNDLTVWTYAIKSSTGALTAVAGSPFAAGNTSTSVTIDPLGRFVYVTNECGRTDCVTGNVSAYTINSSTGALRAVAGSPFPAGKYPFWVAVDPSGRFGYVANFGDNSLSAYTIDRTTGALRAIAGSPYAAGDGPISVTVDPSGQFVYVANKNSSTISAYTINSSTGALKRVAGSPYAAGAAMSVAVDPSGQFAYVADYGGNVSAYAINGSTGALSVVAGSPFAAGHLARGVATAAARGTGTGSVLTLSPRSLAFGKLPIHTSSTAQSVTVTNTSAKTVAITGIALRGTSPGQFTFTDDCGKTLVAYRTCTLEAKFRPTTVGAKTAFLDVNGGGGGRSITLTGTST